MSIFAGKQLSQQLELAEAKANASFVETRSRLERTGEVVWSDFDGTYAMFDGIGSPCTQTFGLGLFSDVTSEQLDQIEEFFFSRGTDVFHEVSPLADPAVLKILPSRGYQPIELTSVMFKDLNDPAEGKQESGSRITTRVIGDGEVDLWAQTSAAGWVTEHESLGEFMFSFGRISASCAGSYPYIAELDAKAIATGMMFVHDGVAILAGASTILEGRRQGAQNALLRARLAKATDLGCTFAAMGASPGSQSQANAQKNGFLVAYTRIKWAKSLA